MRKVHMPMLRAVSIIAELYSVRPGTLATKSNSKRSTECRKDVRHSGDKNHPLSTKSTELNVFNFGNNVDRDKCDVYVGGKVRVLELMRFFYLKHSGSKINFVL